MLKKNLFYCFVQLFFLEKNHFIFLITFKLKQQSCDTKSEAADGTKNWSVQTDTVFVSKSR